MRCSAVRSMAAVDVCAPHERMVLEDVLGSGAVGNTFTYPPARLQVCMPPLPHHTFHAFPFPVPEDRRALLPLSHT